jgi:hypothetical protein
MQAAARGPVCTCAKELAMASEPQTTRPAVPPPPLLARLGLSGMLLAVGGIVGIIVTFLPLASESVSVEVQNPMFGQLGAIGARSETVKVVDNWRGIICLIGYIAAVILAFVLYPPLGLRQKALSWAAVGAGLVTAVFAIWLLIWVLRAAGGGADVMGISVKSAVTVGVGAALNVLTALVVTAGGFLKAREERLI